MSSRHLNVAAGAGPPAARRGAGNEDYIVINRDNTWEEVLVDDQGNETVVQRSRVLSEQTQSGYGRVLDAAKLRNICLSFRDQRQCINAVMETLWPKLQSYADTGLVRCHQLARDQLVGLCNNQLKLFVSGSASRLKRNLVKALLGVDTNDCPFSDKVTVRYRANTSPGAADSIPSSAAAFVVLVHFRQDLSEEELADAAHHPKIQQHLREYGPTFPFRCNSKKELEQILGHHGCALDASWEDVRSSTLCLVDSLEVFLGRVETLDVGLEIIDGPTIKESDIVATALRKQVDGIIFVLNVDEGLNWGPVKQALQYLPEGSVFIICVTSGNEDAEALSAARRQVEEMRCLPQERLCCLPSIMYPGSSVHRAKAQILQLEQELSTYLERHANTRTKEMTRIASDIVDELREQVMRMKTLLHKPPEEMESLRVVCIPKLLDLQEKHERKLKEVRIEYSRQREQVLQFAQEFYTSLAQKVPEMAASAPVAYQVGLTGAFRSSTRDEFARQVECSLRDMLEKATNRWMTVTFLKEVEKRALEFERHMDTALPQMTEMDDIIRSVWGVDQFKSRTQTVEIGAHRSSLPLSGMKNAGLPLSGMTQRLVSYWGVAQGFRSLLAVMSCELMASSAYIFMGALGAAASSWLAIRSAGLETEKQIRQYIGDEVAKVLKERAKETSELVADITMQPCKEAVDRFEASFGLRLEEHRQAIERVVALLGDGGPALVARRARCEEFLKVLSEEQKKLLDAQGDLLRRVATATPR